MPAKIGFFQDAPNSNSMGRLLSFFAACLGGVTVIAGIVFQAAGKDGAGIIAIGAGVFTSGELLKFGSKVAEK